MPYHRPYPILRALKREGDTFTLSVLRLWMDDYSEAPPLTAANDNEPGSRPSECEMYRYELSAEDLIAAHNEDEKNKDNPKHKPVYNDGETRKPQIKKLKKPLPLPPDTDAEAEMVKYLDATRTRALLGNEAVILDMSVGSYTYVDVGRLMGVGGSGKTAYRAGRSKVKGVARTFYVLAA